MLDNQSLLKQNWKKLDPLLKLMFLERVNQYNNGKDFLYKENLFSLKHELKWGRKTQVSYINSLYKDLFKLLQDINDNIKIKISNFSNECYLTHHLFPEIKARQYYALEII